MRYRSEPIGGLILGAALLVLFAGCGAGLRHKSQGPKQDADSLWRVHTAPHRAGLLNIGFDALLARIHLIRSAKRSIKIQTLIWTNDEVGRLILYELIQAAKFGVRVQIIADQMCSETDPGVAAFVAGAHPNMQVRHYNPLTERLEASYLDLLSAGLLDFKKANQRMHNKLIVVDRTYAITGGRNIENTYYGLASRLNFKDRDVLITGPVVSDMAASFDAYWDHPLSVPSSRLKDVAAAMASGLRRRWFSLSDFRLGDHYERVNKTLKGGHYGRKLLKRLIRVRKVAFLADVPGKNRSEYLDASGRITEQVVKLLNKARRAILIQSPYLVLSKRALILFKILRGRNISVTISTNSLAATDNWMTYAMFYKQKRRLIKDLGFRLHEFKPLPDDLSRMWPGYDQHRQQMLGKKSPAGGALEHGDGTATLSQAPCFCLHAKSMVIDGRIACIGSYNLDPRSANLNTELALIVWDKAFARQLRENIRQDIEPGNSWVVWKRYRPLPVQKTLNLLESLNQMVAGVTTLDLWPARHASCFQLKPGGQAVAPGDPTFYENYVDVGNFPLVPATDSKLIYTQLFKALGSSTIPIL
jgi:phosphatidylserine/phosphatidylglycerophosphate/cardiolipin synthase-like enzyme